MNKPRRQRPALTALLDALEAELLAASADEVRDALRETGRSWDSACQQVRSLLDKAAAAAANEDDAVLPGCHDGGGVSLWRH